MVNLDLFREYLNQNSLKNISIESYMRDIEQFCKYLKRMKVTDICQTDTGEVERYCAFLLQKGLAPVSIQRKIASIKRLFNYLCNTGQARCNPAAEISIRKRSVKKAKILTEQQLSRLLSTPDTRSISGIRDKAMFGLIYSTGIKVSELVSLGVKNVRLEEKSLNLFRQGENAALQLDDDVCQCLGAYMALRDMLCPKDEDTLFLNIYGRSITRQGVWKTLKKYAEHAGMEGITLETIRRCFARRYLDSGNDIQSLKDVLGHSDISVTRAYIKH
jgi:integrase/recombinase XerD